jgi:hypothetical protein
VGCGVWGAGCAAKRPSFVLLAPCLSSLTASAWLTHPTPALRCPAPGCCHPAWLLPTYSSCCHPGPSYCHPASATPPQVLPPGCCCHLGPPCPRAELQCHSALAADTLPGQAATLPQLLPGCCCHPVPATLTRLLPPGCCHWHPAPATATWLRWHRTLAAASAIRIPVATCPSATLPCLAAASTANPTTLALAAVPPPLPPCPAATRLLPLTMPLPA